MMNILLPRDFETFVFLVVVFSNIWLSLYFSVILTKTIFVCRYDTIQEFFLAWSTWRRNSRSTKRSVAFFSSFKSRENQRAQTVWILILEYDEWMICRSPTFLPHCPTSVITNSVIYYFYYVVVNVLRSASLFMLSFFIPIRVSLCLLYTRALVSFRPFYKNVSRSGAPPLTLTPTFQLNQMYELSQNASLNTQTLRHN